MPTEREAITPEMIERWAAHECLEDALDMTFTKTECQGRERAHAERRLLAQRLLELEAILRDKEAAK